MFYIAPGFTSGFSMGSVLHIFPFSVLCWIFWFCLFSSCGHLLSMLSVSLDCPFFIATSALFSHLKPQNTKRPKYMTLEIQSWLGTSISHEQTNIERKMVIIDWFFISSIYMKITQTICNKIYLSTICRTVRFSSHQFCSWK